MLLHVFVTDVFLKHSSQLAALLKPDDVLPPVPEGESVGSYEKAASFQEQCLMTTQLLSVDHTLRVSVNVSDGKKWGKKRGKKNSCGYYPLCQYSGQQYARQRSRVCCLAGLFVDTDPGTG